MHIIIIVLKDNVYSFEWEFHALKLCFPLEDSPAVSTDVEAAGIDNMSTATEYRSSRFVSSGTEITKTFTIE